MTPNDTQDDPDAVAESRSATAGDPDERDETDDARVTDPAEGDVDGAVEVRDDAEDADDGGLIDTGDLRTTLYKAGLLALVLLAAIALLRFYLSASRAISIWTATEFEPIVQAAFNLVILLVAGIGISLIVRRLTTA